MQLPLSGSFILSACETGLGAISNGEGVLGLRRAFMVAGAETVVASLWSVSDTVTPELMSRFYQELCSGNPCSRALRTAQRAIKEKHGDPWLWGAFVCHGNPRPVDCG